jgi:hypothetical protein
MNCKKRIRKYFYDVRLEVSIGDIEADYNECGGGNEEAAEEGGNDVDFDDSVMMASTVVPSDSANAAIVQQYSWGKSSAPVSCKGAQQKQLHPAYPSGPLLLPATEPVVPRYWTPS